MLGIQNQGSLNQVPTLTGVARGRAGSLEKGHWVAGSKRTAGKSGVDSESLQTKTDYYLYRPGMWLKHATSL